MRCALSVQEGKGNGENSFLPARSFTGKAEGMVPMDGLKSSADWESWVSLT